MAREVEMADAEKDAAPSAAAPATAAAAQPEDPEKAALADLTGSVSLIERSVEQKEPRFVTRALRQTAAARKKITPKVLQDFAHTFPKQLEVGSVLTQALHSGSSSTQADGVPSTKDSVLPEVEIYGYLVGLVYFIDQKKIDVAKTVANLAIKRIQTYNRRTLDSIAARVYFYFSLAYERSNELNVIRATLLGLHRTATLRHDEIGQETLLNLLLRNYLHYNLYEQAEKLRAKTQRPETSSNQQLSRYLYYQGRIQAIQLEYTDAKECLLQALRKAPQAAKGFRIACTKWATIVRLLLGEIPERTTFIQPGLREALKPYFELTNAVRIGNLELFHDAAEKYGAVFQADKTSNLIVRLRHNVIRTGLRRINLSYSRISLKDVGLKLGLEGTVEDIESIVTKAIRDGGIDATVDHAKGFVQSKETGDIYSTVEPQAAFHSRISFCLNTHNEAVKAMRYPPGSHKGDLETEEKRRERQQQEQDLAKQLAEDDEDEF
eukprot:TRINITY_DN12692_c0_g1_i1.p1 TRINITY_DN12692_c0_g1~~TRINITY_DN12692_c0_g1_i1.p1  ORF type:complete len:493 (+),score=146.53 TRINITY_DN12692_c0_g1_i1:202-1680(+)